MTDELIKHETSILAKEKGFNEPTIYHWEEGIDNAPEGLFHFPGFILRNDELTNTYTDDRKPGRILGEFSAPTQSHLQTWLRKVHSIHIYVTIFSVDTYYFTHYNTKGEIVHRQHGIDGYEAALETGLIYGLNLIK